MALEPIFSEAAEKPAEIKTAVKPEGQPKPKALKRIPGKNSGFSIKSVLNGGPVDDGKISDKEQHNLYVRQDMSEKFTAEQLEMKWKEYLATLDEKPNLKSTLSREPLLREDGTILLRIDNHVQDDLIKNIKPQLVSWLRRELRNSSIDICTEIVDTGIQKFAYTEEEKFEEMLMKNPDLAYLKQRFNLDFDG